MLYGGDAIEAMAWVKMVPYATSVMVVLEKIVPLHSNDLKMRIDLYIFNLAQN